MDIMDEIKDKANDVASVTSKKVAEIYANTKLKLNISERKGQLRNLYRELGEIVYKLSNGNDSVTQNDVEDKIAEINLTLEILDELMEGERQLKKMKLCPYCGEDVQEKSNYCPNCGNEM